MLIQILKIKTGLQFIKEYRFDTKRRFRFDFANLENKIAIEVEGAVYVTGRHTRGKGYENDCEKYNLATCQGWRVLRYSMKQIKNLQKVIDDIGLIMSRAPAQAHGNEREAD